MNAALHSLIQVRLHWAERHCWRAGQRLRQDSLPAHALWIGQSGVVEAHSAQRKWTIERGAALLFPSGAARVVETPHAAQWISIGLSATLPGQNDLLQLLPSPCAWRVESDDALCVLALQLVATTSRGGASTLVRESLARAIFGTLWQQRGAGDLNEIAGANFPDWLGAALRQIHMTPEIGMGVLARQVGISPSQLRRGFHEFLGKPPQEYARSQRLEAARHAIEATDLPLHRIARTHGFSNAAQFSRAIKNAFGLAPIELRRACRQPLL
jgi:AraC-like DNA-binding protein